jgi:hypothetical protein
LEKEMMEARMVQLEEVVSIDTFIVKGLNRGLFRKSKKLFRWHVRNITSKK